MDQMDIVDQQLLRQFSCLGTTDKDELVKQLQILVGNNLSSTSAHFFLDMNDWNLQAAVGSYFDFASPVKLPSMCLAKDDISTLNNEITAPPNTSIRKIWMLLNNGDETWPEGCFLQFSGGDLMSSWERLTIVGPVLPGQTAMLIADLKSPAQPGIYKSKWRLATPTGTYFGDTIWIIMSVIENEPSELVKQMSNLNTFGETPSSVHHQNPDATANLNPFGHKSSEE
ncbi:protein ILRUN isoform X2 [Rhodnius prolixus]|uniref:Nbr1 FW domain-containing protein n=1 Tax=Rhodnius neglectus TaxID=72488 RepID=A0A0P4W0G2_9HEMI